MASTFFAGITLLFWMIIFFVFMTLVTVIVCYNSITKNKNSVIRSWADVIAYERRKNNVLPKIEIIAKEYQQYERDLQTKITQLRASLYNIKPDELNNKVLKEVEDNTSSLIKGIKVAIENYPDLTSSGLMQSLMHQIAKQQENVAAAIAIFNKNVEEFNNGIQTFPGHIVNNYLNKQRKIEPFSDEKASDAFEYQLKL